MFRKSSNSESNPERKGSFIDKFNNLLDAVVGIKPEVIPTMTYETVVEHFTTIRLSDAKVKQAAVLRQPHEQDSKLTHLILMCLDENGAPVDGEKGKSYTRDFLVSSIDKELTDALDESNNVLRLFFKEKRKS